MLDRDYDDTMGTHIDDPLDDRDDSPEEFNAESLERWAKQYDSLNGAPENDGDR